MALSDTLFGVGAEGLDWWQTRKNQNRAIDSLDKGYDQAAGEVKQYQQPYVDFGLQQMGQYNDLGQFNFQFDQNDPSYQWRFDQGLQGVQRTQAGNKMLGSGNTLTALTDYGQGAASQEYQAEFDRQARGYELNKDYNQFGVKVGADQAKSLGENLGDIAMARGTDKAKYYTARQTQNTDSISSIAQILSGQGGDAGVVGGAIKYATEKLGLSGDSALDWASKNLGIAKDSIMNFFGAGAGGAAAAGGAATMFGTGTGLSSGAGAIAGGFNGAAAMGSLPADFGGSFSGALGTSGGAGAAAAGSFAGWASATAGGIGLLFGIKSVVEMLRGEPNIGKTMEKLGSSSDPVNFILNDKWSMQGLFGRDSSAGRTSDKGALLSMVTKDATPEQMQAMRYSPNIDEVVNSLLAFNGSGLGISANNTGVEGVNNYSALAKLFPEIADDIKYVGLASTSRRTAEHSDATSTLDTGSTWMGNWERQYGDLTYKQQKVNSYIATKLAEWENQRTAAGMVAI